MLLVKLRNIVDRDGDELLTEDEFASPPQGHQQHADDMFSDPAVEKQRRKEFQLEIDKNGDKKADRKELLVVKYIMNFKLISYCVFLNKCQFSSISK